MELIISSQRGGMSHSLITSVALWAPAVSADWTGCRRLQPSTGNYICLLNMSHIINTCSWQTRDKARQSQLGREETEEIQDLMDLSTLSSSSGNLSKSKSMHVSELMKDNSAPIRSQRSDGEWQTKNRNILVENFTSQKNEMNLHRVGTVCQNVHLTLNSNFSPWEPLDHCAFYVLPLC